LDAMCAKKRTNIGMNKKEFKKLCGQVRRMPKYAEWKQKILDRDDLGLKSPNIHHWKSFNQILIDNNIKSVADAEKCYELWDLQNGITITRGEHRILSLLERVKTITPGFQQFLMDFLRRTKLK